MSAPLTKYTQRDLASQTGFTARKDLHYPPLDGWTAINSASDFYGAKRGLVWDQADSGSNNNLIGHVRTYTDPITVTAFISTEGTLGTFSGQGLGFRSASGQIVILYLTLNSDNMNLENWNSPTSFSSNTSSVDIGAAEYGHWLRVEDDSTNLKFSFSATGLEGSFVEMYSQGRTSFLTGGPTSVGWWGRDYNAERTWVLRSWREE